MAAAAFAPLRALLPPARAGLSRESVARWIAWRGPCCPRCGAFFAVVFPARPERGGACADCPDAPPFAAARSLFPYEGEVRAAIRAAKYGGVAAPAGPVAGRLLTAIRGEWSDLFPDGFRPVVVPVPIRPWKYLRRGFNLPALVGGRLARLAGWPFDPLLLLRTRERLPQAALPLSLREGNVRGAFAVPRGRGIPRKILLLDDVYTSGATAAECARTLKRAGAEHIVILTVSRAVP